MSQQRSMASHRVVTADGWRLDVLDLIPERAPCAVAVVGHAMMVDRRTVFRADGPSLCGTLCERGFRVLVPDLRGHGASGPTASDGADWSYHELVSDVGEYVDLATRLAPELPLVLVGNSLFGHVALAHLGLRKDAPVSAMAGFAVNIWNRRWSASRSRWWLKQRLATVSHALIRLRGHLPARALRLGNQDEPPSYWRQFATWIAADTWGVGGDDVYARGLTRVSCPFLHVLSEGDRLLAQPDDAQLFTASLPRRELLRLGPYCPQSSLRGLIPGHVEMVSHPRCEPLWQFVSGWLHEHVTQATDPS